MILAGLYNENDNIIYDVEFEDNAALKAYIDSVGGLFVMRITTVEE